MPIDLHVPAGPTGPVWGPGLDLLLSTDLIGPIPIDWSWHVTVGFNPDGGAIGFTFIRPADDQHSMRITPWVDTDPTVSPNFTLADQAPVHINAELRTPTNVVQDSGTLPVKWDTTVALPKTQTPTATGGFTQDDRLQLQAVDTKTNVLGVPADLVVDTPSGPITTTLARLFSRSTLDLLTLHEVTAGPTCDPVRATFSSWYYGVVVRVTTIDPELTPKTPDLEWYFPDLAVLRMFRGGDLRYRRGIHTPTFQTDPPWEWSWNIRNLAEILGGPPAETLAVDWRPGCCGQVFLVRFP